MQHYKWRTARPPHQVPSDRQMVVLLHQLAAMVEQAPQ
jgi:hypothetical protein